MKKWQKKAIKEIMEEFDFARVRKVMLALDWTWLNAPSSPSIEELRGAAEKLLIKGVESADIFHYSSTGGFDTYCDNTNKSISLSFVVEVWEVTR